MTVNLSPVGGAAAQFFTNSGAVLTGGKLYTYLAGTTTPAATYTSASGSTAHTNPIILDASGRVSGGEVWLTAGTSYKFLLKDSSDVLIATYDNITGINGTGITSNAVNVTYDPAGTGAVATTVQSKLRESVSVMDFGAACNGTTDDTAAVQAAVTYCVTNNKDLSVPGMCLLTSSVNIDRLVGTYAAKDYFNIFSIAGGGFVVNTAINMFSSSLTYSGSFKPVSQMINFQNLKFTTNQVEPALSGAYVINGEKFLRTKFTSCSFTYISCLSTTTYIQSIYLYDCNVRFFKGNFTYANTAYDFQVIGGIYEGGNGNCFYLIHPVGCRFSALIEGMTGTALLLPSCSGVDISCYFENNLCDFDCSDTNYFNYGVNIHGCFSASPTGPYSFKWGFGAGLVSNGNQGSGSKTLHYIPDFNPGVIAPCVLAVNDHAQAPGNLSNQTDIAANYGTRLSTLPTLELRGITTATYTTTDLTSYVSNVGNVCTINFQATMTSTAVHATAEQLYIVTDLPYKSAFDYAPCGNIYINNQIYPCFITAFAQPRVLTLAAAIPANVIGTTYVVTGNLSYQVVPGYLY